MAITMPPANMSESRGSVGSKKKFNSGGLIALALLFAVILLIVAAIAVPAVLLHRYYDERLFDMNKRISSYDRANAQRASLLEKRETLRTQDSGKYYLKATTPALASAELQDAVKNIIEATVGPGQVQNTQVAPPKDDGLVRNVSANFLLQTSMPNVRKIFYAIETAQPYLFIDNLNMRTTVGANHKSNPGQEPMVFVQFDVAALARVNAPITTGNAANATPTSARAGASGDTTAGSISKPSAAPAATIPTTAPNAAPQVAPAPKSISPQGAMANPPKLGAGGMP